VFKKPVQVLLELLYIWVMKWLGPIWCVTGRTTATPIGGRCFDTHLKYQVTNAVEMVPFRYCRRTGAIQVLMFRRPDEVGPGNPPEYAGRWHTPGCMQMWGMNPRAGLERVMKKEIGRGSYTIIGSFGPNPDTKRSPRGWEMSLTYMVTLKDAPRFQPDLDGDEQFEFSTQAFAIHMGAVTHCNGQWFNIHELHVMYNAKKLVDAQWENFLDRAVEWAYQNEDQIAWD
jgi:ADP-ribose pyrophosphatase YjhB (NUDIX family)